MKSITIIIIIVTNDDKIDSECCSVSSERTMLYIHVQYIVNMITTDGCGEWKPWLFHLDNFYV